MHLNPTLHDLPHTPQSPGSLIVLTHLPPHLVGVSEGQMNESPHPGEPEEPEEPPGAPEPPPPKPGGKGMSGCVQCPAMYLSDLQR